MDNDFKASTIVANANISTGYILIIIAAGCSILLFGYSHSSQLTPNDIALAFVLRSIGYPVLIGIAAFGLGFVVVGEGVKVNIAIARNTRQTALAVQKLVEGLPKAATSGPTRISALPPSVIKV